MTTQQYEEVALAKLRPHPKNARKGNIKAIAESIKANGWYGVVVAQKSTHYILAGRHRWEAAKLLKMPSVPVDWRDVDDTTALRIVAADNRTSDLASYDDEALTKLLQDIEQTSSGLDGTGFTEADLDKLIASLSQEVPEPAQGMVLSGADQAERKGWTGATPDEYLEQYNNTALRQIQLVMDASEYGLRLRQLRQVAQDHDLESNTAAVAYLLDEYEARQGAHHG